MTTVGLIPVTARNTSLHSPNKIHDDAVARTLGFRGGLVPGVTLYAYMTRAIVAALGRDWIVCGRAAVRFTHPVYDGDRMTLETTTAPGDPAAIEVRALNPGRTVCGVATAGRLDLAARPPLDLAKYPAAPLPSARPAATRANLEAIDVLGSPEQLYDETVAGEYADKFDDPNPMFRGPLGLVHPAFYLDQGNRAFDRNLVPEPWMHVGSEVEHLSSTLVGQSLTTRGRVHRLFEKNGHEFVELDLVLVAGQTGPVARLRQTSIYRLAAARP